MFEAHATGTAVGDRTELSALGGLLSDASDDSRFAAVGSVKSQIGHTKGAAGTAGVMKLALGLHHRILPGTINVDRPSREIAPDSAPFYVNTRTRPWIKDPERPVRRAAASAMGFGGTNFHVVLEEHPSSRSGAVALHRTARAHFWHAADFASLVNSVRNESAVDAESIPADHFRLGFVSLDAENEEHLRALAVEQLTDNPDVPHWNHPEGIYFRSSALTGLRVAALFSGQGSQYVDMGAGAAMAVPPVTDSFDSANASFAGSSTRLGAVVFPPPAFDDRARGVQDEALRRTEYAQPAIGALSAGQFRYLSDIGFRADGYLGHSFGELTALWASGALATKDFFALARARGQSMAPIPGAAAGTMLAVAARREDVDAIVLDIDDAWVCNHNAPDQIVVGGGVDAIDVLAKVCAERGFATRELPVAAAFHTPYVEHAVAAFRPVVNSVRIGTPDATVYANSPNTSYGDDPEVNAQNLIDQLLEPVEFVSALERMHSDGCTVFVEFGPKQILTSLVRRTLGDGVVAVATDAGPLGDSDLALKRAATQLAVLGLELDGINRYQDLTTVEPGPAGMSVMLSAPEYVPQSRRDAYAAALADGYQVETTALAPTPPETACNGDYPELCGGRAGATRRVRDEPGFGIRLDIGEYCDTVLAPKRSRCRVGTESACFDSQQLSGRAIGPREATGRGSAFRTPGRVDGSGHRGGQGSRYRDQPLPYQGGRGARPPGRTRNRFVRRSFHMADGGVTRGAGARPGSGTRSAVGAGSSF
ncbi:acyl transferase domain-containing protein [Rhodococcus sp. 27YEA15]